MPASSLAILSPPGWVRSAASMMFRALSCAVFGSALGFLLIVAGWRRLRQAATGAGPEGVRAGTGSGTRESIFWGMVGIILGVAFIAGVVWFVVSPTPVK